MKYLQSAALGCLLMASFAGVGSAAGDRITVKVPFAFEVHGAELPAGAYTVSEHDPGGVLYLRGRQASVMTESVPASSGGVEQPGLVFERVNGKAYLIGVQLYGSDSRAVSFARPSH